jgi:hypothetical protein
MPDKAVVADTKAGTGRHGFGILSFSLKVTAAVLNHVSGSRWGIAGVYERHDWAAEKRAALDAWALHVLTAVSGQAAAGNVVALVRAG